MIIAMSMQKNISISCDVCGQDGMGRLFDNVLGLDGIGYALYECSQCGMIAVWPTPSEDFLNSFYRRNYKGKVKEGIKIGRESCRERV